MALFEDESLEDLEAFDFCDEKNSYLENPQKGISLIKSMLEKQKRIEDLEEFNQVLSNEIIPILVGLELKNEFEIYQMLTNIYTKMKEQQKIHVLKGKKVLGIGGKFSAGKSCFINSIANAELPEGQRPTTSIATYIVNKKKKENIAISNWNNRIVLDDEAVAALTHQFYNKYKISFSRLIQNLVIYTPNFTYPNIALLDTPGYSKSDNSKKEDFSDAELAREQLKSVDYLIWLIDAVQGVVTQRDLEFISSLQVSTKILVIFTKADCEIESNLEKKIVQAKSALKGINKDIYDVIAYNSRDRQAVIGEGVLESFLSMIDKDKTNIDKTSKQLKWIEQQLKNQLNKKITKLSKTIKVYEKILSTTSNIEHIKAIVKEYGIYKAKNIKLTENKEKLGYYFQKLIQIADRIETV